MSEALKLWLRECWELWYWAMFCPSRLQERMNEWSHRKKRNGGIQQDTSYAAILIGKLNRRFLSQFIQIACCFSVPLVLQISIYGQSWDWLLLPITLLIAYSLGCWFLPIGLNIPLVFSVVYLVNPTFFITILTKVIRVIPPLPQIVMGFFVGESGIIATILLLFFLKKDRQLITTILIIICLIISVLAGSWIGSQNQLFALFAGAAASFLLFLNIDDFQDKKELVKENILAFMLTFTSTLSLVIAFIAINISVRGTTGVIASIIAIGISVMIVVAGFALIYNYWFSLSILFVSIIFIVVFIVAIFVAGIIENISTLPLALFVFICWLVAASLSPLRQGWLGVIITGVMAILGIENQGRNVLISIPITLIGYFRLFPDFGVFIFFSNVQIKSFNPLRKLRLLPPYTSELVWLPLPNHDRILVSAFNHDSLEALSVFQAIQSQPLFGFQQTIKLSLSELVTDQLVRIKTISEIITTGKKTHKILPILVPSLYESILTPNIIFFERTILASFIKKAQDIEAALKAGSVALRERGLEKVNEQLDTLHSQLSSLVKGKSIRRWQMVIDHWQTIIQGTLEQLQQESQGEILNPFQYGNPLASDRAQLFKGRYAFADQIVRQILDRNRPTIILYGPRRCGKSSFLLNLPRILGSDYLPVYIDAQSQSASQSEADFCFTIVRAIHRDARSQQVLLPAPPEREEFHLSPYTQLEDWLDTALSQLGDRRILLNIDEFEAIGTAMEQERITTKLFDELRSLIQHWDRLSFLFSGVQTLDELGTNWSSYFISAMPIEMTYLNPDEAKELLENPDPEFTLEYDTGIVDQILTLTRCHPYLLQLLGWVLVQLANTTHTQLVTPTLLQSAIPEAYINGIGYFTNVWEQFTGTTPTEITAGQQQLLALAQGQQPHPIDEAAQKSLQRMLRYHIIEKIDNQYKFEVPLIERWVREKSN
jgi:hypothetical protein